MTGCSEGLNTVIFWWPSYKKAIHKIIKPVLLVVLVDMPSSLNSFTARSTPQNNNEQWTSLFWCSLPVKNNCFLYYKAFVATLIYFNLFLICGICTKVELELDGFLMILVLGKYRRQYAKSELEWRRVCNCLIIAPRDPSKPGLTL